MLPEQSPVAMFVPRLGTILYREQCWQQYPGVQIQLQMEAQSPQSLEYE